MINHARTLLLNSDGASRPDPAYFMEEYVDPKFRALTLPNYLARARAPLFDPTAADEAYKNYIMRLCTTILHSTEFESYVYALDRRVTYLNRPSVAMTTDSKTATPTNALAKTGRAELLGVPGGMQQRIQWDWDIDVVSGGPSVFVVQVTLRNPYKRQEFNVNFSGGHSDLIQMPGQKEIYFRFYDTMTAGMTWTATLFSMQNVDPATLLQGFESNGDAAGQLFDGGEPFKTFRDLWNKHAYLNYKMSGYLLALIYRMEEVRLNGQ